MIRPQYLIRTRDMLGLRWLRDCRERAVGTTRRAVTPGTPAVIVGTLATASGIGNGARLMLMDLKQRQIPCLAVDVTGALGMAAVEPNEFGTQSIDQLPPFPRIVHLNPPHFGRALRHIGRSAFAAPVIGYWAWELEEAPRNWISSVRLADEIWVPSPFVRDAVSRILSGAPNSPNLRVVPHAVMAGPLTPRDAASRSSARQRLGLAKSEFVAGFTFSMLAGLRRKNPEGIIAAFRAAFPAGREQATLLLRCTDPHKNWAAWKVLQEISATDCRIHAVNASECSITDFFSVLDVLVSLHRAEGYGLTMAEALRFGIPVVATPWGLSDDLVSHSNFHAVPYNLVGVDDPGGSYAHCRHLRWANPDVIEAAALLQKVRIAGSSPTEQLFAAAPPPAP